MLLHAGRNGDMQQRSKDTQLRHTVAFIRNTVSENNASVRFEIASLF
jgi:hypothetical protein